MDNTDFVKETESSTVSNVIELFILDLSLINGFAGANPTYWTPSGVVMNGNIPSTLTFSGNNYIPYPVRISGISQSSEGAYPRPQLDIANVDKIMGGLSFIYDDIVGASITYMKTFSNFIEAGLSSPPLKYYIARKLSHDINVLSFELRTALDKERAYLPSRQMLKKDFPGLGINKSVK
jgi:lambda family phage minor tail protein L